MAVAQAPQALGVLPVQKYGCEDAAGAEALAYALAEQQAVERGWALREVRSVERMPESCGMRSAEWQFSYVDEKSGKEHLLVQRLEFTDATPLYVRFPGDCFCTHPIASWDELAPALLSLRYGVQRGRPITEGGNCERPALEYEDELLEWNEQTGYFVLLRHWEVHQPCPNGGVYQHDQYIQGVLDDAGVAEKKPSPALFVQSDGTDQKAMVGSSPFLSVLPNPSTSYIELNFSLPQDSQVDIELLNAMGMPVGFKKQYVSGGERETARFSLSHLPAGMYWIRVCSGEISLVRAFVKMK